MLHNPMPGMTVRYTGETLLRKFPDEMKRDKVGEIVGRVDGEPDAVVVEFGNAAYIVDVANLEKYNFKEKSEMQVDVRILRKWQVADDTAK